MTFTYMQAHIWQSIETESWKWPQDASPPQTMQRTVLTTVSSVWSENSHTWRRTLWGGPKSYHYLADSGIAASNDVLFKGCHHVRLSIHIYLVLLEKKGYKTSVFTFKGSLHMMKLSTRICLPGLPFSFSPAPSSAASPSPSLPALPGSESVPRGSLSAGSLSVAGLELGLAGVGPLVLLELRS